MLSKLKKIQYQEQEAENRQNIKTASLNSKFTSSKKEQYTLTCSLLKDFETLCNC